MIRLFDFFFEFVALEGAREQGWGRWAKRFGIFFILVVGAMSLAREFVNPNEVTFPQSVGTDWDYRSMIGMGMLLIAIDAMILVLISFGTLKTWQSVLVVSGFVALTHIFYPLTTFGLTAGTYWLATRGFLPFAVARGVMTAIYFVAILFVAAHLREVHSNVRNGESERFKAAIRGFAWSAVFALAVAIFPEVHGVSVDALMIGPAKIAFVARYSVDMFIMSFVYIGLGVGMLVMLAGFVVMAFNRWIATTQEVARKVQKIDFYSSLLLVVVFIHFTVFASVYWIYTFVPLPWLLEAKTIWGSTAVLSSIYFLTMGRPKEIWKASFQRAGLSD